MNEAMLTIYGVVVCGYALSIGSLIDRWGGAMLCAFIIANDI